MKRLALLLPLLAFDSFAAAPAPTPIAGRWSGESICVKAPWNAACNDEVIQYDFVPSKTRPGGVLLHAAKKVNGAFEPMYDLEFTFDSTTGEWAGDFANSRVKIRWLYVVKGDQLIGRVVDQRTGRIGRNVTARRAEGKGS